jgi:hypothetical protein
MKMRRNWRIGRRIGTQRMTKRIKLLTSRKVEGALG